MGAKRKFRTYCHPSEGENEDEKTQWNRKRCVLLIEIFMYFRNAYILSWDETTAFYTLLGILNILELKKSGE
jgi:hypothetical protein